MTRILHIHQTCFQWSSSHSICYPKSATWQYINHQWNSLNGELPWMSKGWDVMRKDCNNVKFSNVWSAAFFASSKQQVEKKIVRSPILSVFIEEAASTIDGKALLNRNIKGQWIHKSWRGSVGNSWSATVLRLSKQFSGVFLTLSGCILYRESLMDICGMGWRWLWNSESHGWCQYHHHWHCWILSTLFPHLF